MIAIEPFAERHIAAALALWSACDGIGLGASDSPPEIAAFLARNPGISAICSADDAGLAGAVLCGHDGRRGYLHHLAVRADRRGEGIARALVSHCLAELARAGIPRASIHVFADNAEGIAFWSHLGWRARADLTVLQRELVQEVACQGSSASPRQC
jgi:ribosomal protein S18 acetylase RimI-like enzyme